ncbi:MAG: nucleoside hydrolase [Candidatus Glassbacteria bacterium]|nr:nucleoside hydrolase [Candidatus Glassbacteria bacterium]
MRTFYGLPLFAAFVLCSAGSDLSAEKIKVVIDTDIAEDIDDILCTAFALASPEFEVLAITTVDGNVAARSRVARKVAQLYGRPELPVAEGYVRNIPLPDTTYLGFSGGVRYGEVAPDEEGLPPPSLLKADELIARLAERYPGEVSVVTIGSMANIGQLLTRYPQSAAKLKQIVSNGGSFSREQHSIGWNLRYDPIAAITAARSAVPWVLLSESTSRFCGPRAEDVKRLEESKLPTAKLLVDAIRWWRTNKVDATSLPHVSDLNVFAYLLGGWVETTPGHVFIEIGPRGFLPGFRVEDNPEGRILLGREIPRDKGAELREIFMTRLLSEPIHR